MMMAVSTSPTVTPTIMCDDIGIWMMVMAYAGLVRRKSFSKEKPDEDDPNKAEDDHPYRLGKWYFR